MGNRLSPDGGASDARRRFRTGLESGRLLRFPGAFTPLSAQLIAEHGFDGIYISGAVLSAELGLPDIGLTTLTEVAERAEQITATTPLPTLLDADTGFGAPINVARTVSLLERKGVSGCHVEDQVGPKRCGHLDGKRLVPIEDMVQRIAAAVHARSDPSFVICARTDARTVEGFDAAMARARAYKAAGADLIFPEALANRDEFARARDQIDGPILANMTEFGRSELLDTDTLETLGYNVVVYPVTLLRIAMGAIEAGLKSIASAGSQKHLIEQMQTRARLYELVHYADYQAFDTDIFAFDIPNGKVNSADLDPHRVPRG